MLLGRGVEMDFLLDYRATATEAEIFWDLPEDATLENQYIVLADGKEVARTGKDTYITYRSFAGAGIRY